MVGSDKYLLAGKRDSKTGDVFVKSEYFVEFVCFVSHFHVVLSAVALCFPECNGKGQGAW